MSLNIFFLLKAKFFHFLFFVIYLSKIEFKNIDGSHIEHSAPKKNITLYGDANNNQHYHCHTLILNRSDR